MRCNSQISPLRSASKSRFGCGTPVEMTNKKVISPIGVPLGEQNKSFFEWFVMPRNLFLHYLLQHVLSVQYDRISVILKIYWNFVQRVHTIF